jgi:zinc transport system ATP-binding protein
MNEAAALVQVAGVSVSFGSHLVLDGVDLTVMPRRIVTVVGPNGAGKSTLLKVVLGLLAPSGGTVRRAPGAIGYVPQRLTVERTLPLSVRRFLAMAVSGRAAPLDRLEAALEAVKAGHVLSRQVADLSGGELQRVMLARALLRQPSLLVLDEPVGGVDMAGQAEIYDLIATLAHRDGVGVLMVSHDLHVVMGATDEVVCLNRHVCCAGHPEAISRHPEYLKLFGPRVAASLAIYTHAHDHGHLPDGSVDKLAGEGGHLPPPHHHGPECRHG